MAVAPEEPSPPLSGGWQTTVRRAGGTITRSPGPWSRSVIELLRHLEHVGFAASPRPVGNGFDTDGNEHLTYVSGESPHPLPWGDEAIAALGAMSADLHEAMGSFRPGAGAVWKRWYGRDLGDRTLGFGHGDLGPWNVMAVDGLPAGIIDWDSAGPMDPMVDLAQAAWLNVQLHDDDIAERVGLGDAAQRSLQLRLFLDGYRLPSRQRTGFVDRMIEVAISDAASEAIEHRISPETTTGVAADGYPFAWGIAWRTRAAAWMVRHRRLLERAIASSD